MLFPTRNVFPSSVLYANEMREVLVAPVHLSWRAAPVAIVTRPCASILTAGWGVGIVSWSRGSELLQVRVSALALQVSEPADALAQVELAAHQAQAALEAQAAHDDDKLEQESKQSPSSRLHTVELQAASQTPLPRMPAVQALEQSGLRGPTKAPEQGRVLQTWEVGGIAPRQYANATGFPFESTQDTGRVWTPEPHATEQAPQFPSLYW
jgi:hypothetical protein